MSLRGTLGAGLLLLGLVLPAPARAALEWKFKEGDKFYVEAVTETKQTITIDEKKTTSASTFTTVNSFVVKKADAGSYTLEQTVEGVKVKSDKDDTAAGVAALVAFVLVELRSRHPLVPPALFANPVFSAANAVTLLVYAALGAPPG